MDPRRLAILRACSLSLQPASPDPEVLQKRLQALDDATLRTLFSSCWEDTKAAFSHEFNISSSNFGRWSNGRIESKPSADAVRAFLGQVISRGRVGLRSELLNSEVAPAPTYEAKIYGQHDFPSDWAHLEARIGQRLPRVVVFLDGDQALDQVKRLLWLLPDPVLVGGEADWEVHLLVTAGRQTKMPRWWPEEASWCSWIRAHSRRKESADLATSVQVTHLHRSLPAGVQFVIASEDRFAASLAELFGGWGRICRALTPSSLDLGLSLLLETFPDPSFISVSPAAWQLRKWLELGRWEDCLRALDQLSRAPDAVAHLTPDLLRQAYELLNPEERQPGRAVDTQHPALRAVKQLLAARPLLPLGLILQRFPWTPAMCTEFHCPSWHRLLQRSEVLAFLGAEFREPVPASFALVRCASGL